MNLFHGVHEVRMLRPNGIAVGYFDNWESALKAVEAEPTQYKAAYPEPVETAGRHPG